MAKFFTADTHFGHAKIIEYCSRPFVSVQQMDEEMIRRWNSVVSENDEVYHVGDFSFRNAAESKKIRSLLKGEIFLVEGNHDGGNYGFGWMKPYYELKVGTQEIVLFHYGMRTWHHDLRGTWHLYGHSHGQLPAYGKSFDIGVDCHGFTPISFGQVERIMAGMEIAKHPRF
jgi:calcineurin-like phosphoesterase family protein